MKWPAYPNYRPSGLEWLGELPAHWETPPLYARYAVELGKMLDEGRITGSCLVPFLRNVDVQWDRINFDDLPELDVPPAERSRYTVRTGDLLVCEGGEVGRAAIVPAPGTGFAFQKALHRMRPTRAGEEPRFMFYVLAFAAGRGVFVAEGNPNTIPHLTGEKLRRYRLPTPPSAEQKAIAKFLDTQSARLDLLIARKQALIERLHERRAAVISRTVTRGLPPAPARAASLDPHPTLKPSGIAWLGEVPSHWSVKRLKHVVHGIEQGWSPDCSSYPATGDEWGVVKAGCCNGGRFNADENKALPPDLTPLEALEIKPGDLLMSRASGSEELVGSVALVPVGTRSRLLLSDKTYRMRCRKEAAHAPLLSWVLGSEVGRFQVRAVISGASGLAKNIAQADVREFAVPLPPLPEQRAIADYLDRETARINRMVEKVEAAIERLQEYRSALITAAVTGRIDVRGRT